MKPNAALAKTILLAASIGMTVPLVVPGARAQSRPGRPMQATDEEPKVVGIEVARDNGGFLGVAVEGLALVVRFYDEERKPVPADVARATVWWDPVNKAGKERTVLNPSPDGLSLRSPAKLRPPYVYDVVVTFLSAEGEALKTHFVDLKQLPETE